ncbi:DUF6265 family protein [Janthinobacterium agaricidamnosum]|nr:DUF6265 family protein [Janthinobacterium agaricidamnosum]
MTLASAALVFAASTSHAAVAAASETESVAKLSWLAGCWHAAGPAPRYEEKWTPASDGSISGTTLGMRDGKYQPFEFAQLRVTEPGQLAYVAKPNGAPPVVFNLLSGGKPNDFTFGNLDNDFPSRIVYHRDNANSLRVSIIGTLKGKFTTVQIPMTRGKCETK